MGRLWIPVVLTLLAFGVRAGSLTAQSFWRDEVDALCYAHEFPYLLIEALAPGRAGALPTPCACPPPPLPTDWAGGTLQERIVGLLGAMIRQNGPLYYFLLRGWIVLVGYSEYALRYFSLLFGVLCVPLTLALGTRLMGRTAALVAAALTALAPYMVWYGQEVKMYTLVPALVLLALYGLRRGMDGGKIWWVVPVLATTLLLYTHIWGALLIPFQILGLLVEWPRWRRHWRGALISMALITLPYLPLALWQAPAALVRRETGFPHYSLGEMALILLNGWSTGILGQGWPWGALVCGGAAALGWVRLLSRSATRQTALFLSLWLGFPLLVIWFISLRQPLFTDRYLIWCAPAFYLLIGAGWMVLTSKTRGHEGKSFGNVASLGLRGMWLLALLAVFTWNLHTQATVPIKSDVRAAAAYVEARYRPGDLLIFQIPHIRYTFDYYFGPTEYLWADGLYTNHRTENGVYRLSEDAAGRWMALIVGDRRRVWLVASEVEMWDERNLVQGWLETVFRRTDEAHFVRIDVYEYQR
ncbi:MAG: glycosyltransferase family 39 protein [Anaerolineae bacterium]|nr:glycosyltransferase family 39 protein [Anaerolineae bacterium]MDW8069003.1 glycosyltransferase family 39 protein [Anaerolineae bacterium]